MRFRLGINYWPVSSAMYWWDRFDTDEVRRDFALTIVDLPSVWTAWTSHVLHLADRVVMVTRLSVAHVHLARRQIGILTGQGRDRLPLTLACNAVSGDQQNLLSVKAAERARRGRSRPLYI